MRAACATGISRTRLGRKRDTLRVGAVIVVALAEGVTEFAALLNNPYHKSCDANMQEISHKLGLSVHLSVK